jgi:hypothetical protein
MSRNVVESNTARLSFCAVPNIEFGTVELHIAFDPNDRWRRLSQ